MDDGPRGEEVVRAALQPAGESPPVCAGSGVLLLSGDSFMGLAILRSLGRGGVRVVAAQALPDGIGRYSRYCAETVPMPRRGPHLAQDVLLLCRRHGVSHVIATSEDMIIALNEARHSIEPEVRLLFPPSEVTDIALHKDKTLAVAERAAVPVPRTVHPRGMDDFERCAALGFPLVMKPAHRDPRLGVDHVLDFKVLYIQDADELRRRLESFEVIGEFPLVQEYCEGKGVGIEALCRDGEPLLLFQHKRVHELPPDGGVSVVCESVAVDHELALHATRLLRAMRWDGVAMVEFRRDDESGRTVLMEVNGRFWGSLPLAVHAGADFPHLLYRAFSGDGPLPEPRGYDVGVRCRDLIGDTRRLIEILRTGCHPRGRAVLEWLRGFGLSTRWYGWSDDDPLPALMGFLVRPAKLLGLLRGVPEPISGQGPINPQAPRRSRPPVEGTPRPPQQGGAPRRAHG